MTSLKNGMVGIGVEKTLFRNRLFKQEETVMGQRCKMMSQFEADSAYRVMEVVMMKRGRGGEESALTHVMLVDNNQETIKFVQESMDDIIGNLIRMDKMTTKYRKVDESARMFEENLTPIFNDIAETAQVNIIDKLSVSLRKALILMAMERYQSNRDSVCRALGISPEKLDHEMVECGIRRERNAA